MKKLLAATALLVVVTGLAIWLDPTRIVWGWLRNEAFVDGRPTSWWESQISAWDLDCPTFDGENDPEFKSKTFWAFRQTRGIWRSRHPTFFTKVFGKDFAPNYFDWLTPLSTNPDSKPVLDQLLLNPHANVRIWAKFCLTELELKAVQSNPIRIHGGVGP